jgi:DNA polymerase
VTDLELVLHRLEARGIRVFREGVRLVLEAPKGAIDPASRRVLMACKPELMARLPDTLSAVAHDAPAAKTSHSTDVHDKHDVHAQNSTSAPTGDMASPPPTSPASPRPEEVAPRRSCTSSASGDSRVDSGRSACTSDPATAEDSEVIPTIIDFETQSLASLESIGGRLYARHETTKVICMVAKLPDGHFVEWSPPAPLPADLVRAIETGTPVLAHNANGFDRFIWESLRWPSPSAWLDSLPLARLLGLPGSLDGIGETVLGRRKDEEGHRLTKSLSRPDRKTGLLPTVTPATRARVGAYCRRDVELLADAQTVVFAAAAHVEADVRAVDVAINDRGFAFDRELAHAVIDCEASWVREAQKHSPVSPTVLASQQKLRRWLSEAGVSVKDVRAGTLEALLDDADLPDDARRVILARVASASITSHKLRAALQRLSPDGRLRDALVFHAAHTGRWSGRGFQPHNLPRGLRKLDSEAAVGAALDRNLDRLRALAADAEADVEEVLGALVRPCVVAPQGSTLGIVDYSSIEARGLMWLGGDVTALKAFEEGMDTYKVLAASLLGVPVDAVDEDQRNLGKAAELGCGYGMGAARLEGYAEAYNVVWSLLPVTPTHVVEGWRDAHPAVAGDRTGDVFNGHVVRVGGLWKDLEFAAKLAAAGDRIEVSYTRWERVGDAVVCILPSGRRLTYRKAEVEEIRTRWGSLKPTFTYELRGQRVTTYGGKLVENVTQALCRDLLAHSLVELERAGIRTVLHVHDEVVAELDAPEQLARMKEIMCTAPDWALGLPLAVKGGTATRYSK